MPATPATPAPTTAATPGRPAAPVPNTPTVSLPAENAAKVNLNTATAAQLGTLPGVGPARSKAILAERAKGNFKDWADFDKRVTSARMNAGTKAKIKDRVTF
ncbi:MAG TPA: helix-hairpin-helix domain-containing protein [Acetobacteraceae bacterium]